MKLKEYYKRAKAKNVKQMRGHDAPSHEWDIYFDGKKICNCYDDSYGGELQISNYKNQNIEDIFNKIEKKDLWTDENIPFLTSKKWKFERSLDTILMDVLNLYYKQKDLQRESKKGILIAKQGKYSDFKQSFLIRGSQYTIPNTFKKYGTRVASDFYQSMIDNALAKNEEILNKEYLKEFGLRVTKELVT